MFIKGTGPMRNHWKALIPIAISFMTLAGCGQSERVETPLRPAPPARFCDPQTARVLGRAYVFSIPTANAERLVNFIQQNKSYFVEDGAVIKCARALGNRLVWRLTRTSGCADPLLMGPLMPSSKILSLVLQ